MIDFDLDEMLFTIKGDTKDEDIIKTLRKHTEVKFVSFRGVDLAGHVIDENIPIKAFIKDFSKLMESGVQTDGSSVALPLIAELSNARVDILPDRAVNWYVEYNYYNMDYKTNLPVGTLRIPSFLRHNGDMLVGPRIFLKRQIERFKEGLIDILQKNPYVFEHLGGISDVSEIEELNLTSATELEFWVKTPSDKADRAQLSASQELKEQYWKRTIGPVGTALEQSIEILERYGFEVEMGHKETGGVKAKMGQSGSYDHIMEQLEIDWKYANPMQAADNEIQVKNVVKDVFRKHRLEVTFYAKPIIGVAGNGEHTHLGMTAKLKNGKVINLFEAKDRENEFMSPIGFGALMGILKNYDIINPFVSATNDSFNRMKPDFEAPVCTVTSLGMDCKTPSRNRTVLIGLIRDLDNPLATRFELRSPNPHSNTFMVIGAGYASMLDGIRAVLIAKKTAKELEESISKEAGEDDFYLLKDRKYRSEENVFDYYTPAEREKLFGKIPLTVWENFKAFDDFEDRMSIIHGGDEVLKLIISSYRAQMIGKWSTEIYERIIPNTREYVRECIKRHDDECVSAYDLSNWNKVSELRYNLAKDTESHKSLLTKEASALERRDFEEASRIEIEILSEAEKLREAYNKYIKNLF